MLDAVTEHLGIPVPPPGMPDPFAFSDCGKLEELLREGGFRDISIREVAAPVLMSSFDEWWDVVPSLASPVGPLLEAQPADIRGAIRGQISAALDKFRTDTDYDLPGVSLVGVGHH